MKQKILALLIGFAAILCIGLVNASPAAASAQKGGYCVMNGKNYSAVVDYTHYRDGSNRWRVKINWMSATHTGAYAGGNVFSASQKLEHEYGVAWQYDWSGSGIVQTFAPAQANALLIYSPHANTRFTDNGNSCTVFLSVY